MRIIMMVALAAGSMLAAPIVIRLVPDRMTSAVLTKGGKLTVDRPLSRTNLFTHFRFGEKFICKLD